MALLAIGGLRTDGGLVHELERISAFPVTISETIIEGIY
jgi:hypothetical protein